jgi:magnesium transporter
MRLETHLIEEFVALDARDAARALETVSPESTAALLLTLRDGTRGALMRFLPNFYLTRCLESLSPADAAAVASSARDDVIAPVLRSLQDAGRDAIVAKLSSAARSRLERLLRYPDGVAGALMDPHILSVADDATVEAALARARAEPEHVLYYVYVVNGEQRLVGVLNLRELLLAAPQARIGDVAHTNVESLPALSSWESVIAHPGWEKVHTLPVVEDGRFVGAIRYESIRRLEQRRQGQVARDPSPRTGAALAELYGLGLRGLLSWGQLGGPTPLPPTLGDSENDR